MAIEYVLETLDSVSAAEATLRHFAAELGVHVEEDGFAQREGLHIMTSVLPADEIETTEFLLGYRDVVSTTFRFLNNTDPALEQRNLDEVVAAVVSFLDSTSDQRGVFTQEGERILLQRLSSEPVVFDSAWREHAFDASPEALDAVEHGHLKTALLQPVLSEDDLETLKSQQESF
ncbi:SitI3 family protein [Phytomonospora endophytica]|uniref:Uncharacterized protein n=1 Tax=Phytomonospora endophytica TaxID=714109 RepID=A0A841FZ79_9ACTN|nr:SitI3 family protein [Phytomonospora endophytica]MBB6037749.1 hypothetical protein [Phytomonospora endophytica]GIG67723.1 hypothetical protein Pen01_40180 [Phytomonospora endophytica]